MDCSIYLRQAINVNDDVNKVSLAGVAGNADDFYEKDFLPKGNYIILKASQNMEIK